MLDSFVHLHLFQITIHAFGVQLIFFPLIYKQNRFQFFDINTAGNHFCTYKYIKNTELILIEFLKHLSEVALTIQWGWMIFKPCIR